MEQGKVIGEKWGKKAVGGRDEGKKKIMERWTFEINKDGRRKRREEGRERDRSNGENEGKMKGQEGKTERTNMKFCLECLKLFSSGFYHKDSRLRPHGGVFGPFRHCRRLSGG